MKMNDIGYGRLIGAVVALLTLLALTSLMGGHLFHQRSDQRSPTAPWSAESTNAPPTSR